MARTWTQAQLSAINSSGKTLLVSAAAGSGKTATLTEKIIRSLTDKENPAELSRMLIVTFTRAAAAELKERISSALSGEISKDPSNKHLYRQLISLGSADICTIDSFYMKPIREHFAECGLPASFRIADEAELNPLRERILSEVIDDFFIKYAQKSDADDGLFSILANNAFADLCDSITPAKSDGKLIPTILMLYEKLLAYPRGFDILLDEAEDLRMASGKDFFNSKHGNILRRRLTELCDSAIPAYTIAVNELTKDEKAVKAYLPAFTKDLDFYTTLASVLNNVGTYEEVAKVMVTFSPLSLSQYRNAPYEITAYKNERDIYKSATDTLKKSFFPSDAKDISAYTSNISFEMEQTALMCEVLYDLLTEYDRKITAEKRGRGICDFTDNRRILLSLLVSKDGLPTKLAKEYAGKYDTVFIDEYQDVDEIQDTIFSLIGTDHRFMVGDIKQSIYGFRGAEASVFAKYRNDLPPIKYDPDSPIGNSIFMSENFRCNEPVIKMTNTVCGHIFAACPDTIGYTSSDDLKFAKQMPLEDSNIPPVQIDLIIPENLTKDKADKYEDSRTDIPAEAVILANNIAKLLRHDNRLADGKRITPSDITILVRNRSNLAEVQAALSMLKIPSGCEELENATAGQDLLHGPDMIYLLNLLRIINDPDNDIPLSEIMRVGSPQHQGFTLDEMLTIREKRSSEDNITRESLYYTLQNCISTQDKSNENTALIEKSINFIAWIEKYRKLSITLSAEELLRVLKRDKNCYCRHSQAFIFLYESARTYRATSFTGLYTFLTYFERVIASNNVSISRTNNSNKVSIITMHGSKGLEFPVCFLYKCGKAFASKSLRSDLLFEKEAGVSLKLFFRNKTNGGGCKRDTILRRVTKLAVTIREREDEMRLLYVAMTRAREYLFISATGTKTIDSLVPFTRGDRFRTLECNSYLAWILSAVKTTSIHASAHEYFLINTIGSNSIKPDTPLPPVINLPAETNMDQNNEFADHYRSLHLSPPIQSTEDKLLRIIPTKAPASRIIPHMLDKCIFYDRVFEARSTDDLGSDTTDKIDKADVGTDFGIDYQTRDSVLETLRLMHASDKENEFEILLRANKRPTPVEKGTAAHLFLQFCDYGPFKKIILNGGELSTAVSEEIARLCKLGFIDSRLSSILDPLQIKAFFKSRLFSKLINAENIGREVRFNRFIPLATLTSDEHIAKAVGNRTLYVQGSIDLVIHNSDGTIELCDYKSDRITAEEKENPSLLAQHMREKHLSQLRQYAEAIFDLYHKYPSKIYIYSLPLGEAIEINID